MVLIKVWFSGLLSNFGFCEWLWKIGEDCQGTIQGKQDHSFVSWMLNALKISRNQHNLLMMRRMMLTRRGRRRISKDLHLHFLLLLTAMWISPTTLVVESLVAPIVPHLVLVLREKEGNTFSIYHKSSLLAPLVLFPTQYSDTNFSVWGLTFDFDFWFSLLFFWLSFFLWQSYVDLGV